MRAGEKKEKGFFSPIGPIRKVKWKGKWRGANIHLSYNELKGRKRGSDYLFYLIRRGLKRRERAAFCAAAYC